jgi:very-short-patch-repair endonuclease
MRRKVDRDAPDRLIARTAAKQHGVVSTRQLHTAGLSDGGITRRLAAGRIHRMHRGVFAVGHRAVSMEGRWMAAVLACGRGAVLSHRSAAELWGIRRPARRPSRGTGRGEGVVVDVTVSGTAGRKRQAGIALHRSSTLTPADWTHRDRIPVTGPARTLADLRPGLSEHEFSAAVREAEFLRLPIGDRFATNGTRTRLEARMLALCRRHRLPKPEVNVKVDRNEVDFLWRDRSLIAEADGWQSHGTRSAFEEDRARDARLKLLGYDVVRFTWRQISDDPAGVAATIRALLRARSA